MTEGLDYEQALAVVRGSLIEVAANARAFRARASGRPRRLAPRGLLELAEIEGVLAQRLERALQRELRVDPWPWLARVRSGALVTWRTLARETPLLEQLVRRARALPLERWRAGAPQLESELWPLFVGRTHHLANTLSLALDEPAPFPAIVWHPGRREFVTRH